MFDVLQEWGDVAHLDISPEVYPDVVHDLNVHPLPFEDSTFDQIHAYDVLEHLGKQGDYQFFCNEWNEYWRILRPGGEFWGMTPFGDNYWIWGDPGHTRHISSGTLIFLNQENYRLSEERGAQMTDYRGLYKGNFAKIYEKFDYQNNKYIFTLRAMPI